MATVPVAVAMTGALSAALFLGAPAQADEAPVDTPSAAPMTTSQAPTKRELRAARASRDRASLVREALKHVGQPYVAGAAGPRAFDCSGLVMYIYQRALGKSLPHYSGAQMARTKRVSLQDLQPGDLLFYGPGGSQHVSMYIGKGKMIQATNPSRGVAVDSIRMSYYVQRFAGAGRIVNG